MLCGQEVMQPQSRHIVFSLELKENRHFVKSRSGALPLTARLRLIVLRTGAPPVVADRTPRKKTP